MLQDSCHFGIHAAPRFERVDVPIMEPASDLGIGVSPVGAILARNLFCR